MHVKTVSIQYGRKLQVGEWGSAHADITLWADIGEDEDLDAAMRSLWEMATANVKSKLLPFTQKAEAKLKEVFLGLPVELQQETEPETERTQA